MDEVFGWSPVFYVLMETRRSISPRLDVKETKKNYKIVFDLPGLDREGVEISVRDGVLKISGEKKLEKEEDEDGYKYVERSYESYCRSVSLPDSVDTDKIKSVYKNGLLTVTLPKAGKALEEIKKGPVTTA